MLLTALALAGGGCSSAIFDKGAGQGWFQQPLDIFRKHDWAGVEGKASDMDTGGPVAAEELVGADGRCAAAVAQASAPQATAPAPEQPASNSAVGTMTGELGSEPAPASPTPIANEPAALGGIALGMSECQTVRRAGTPANVNISAGNQGQRQVVLTYLSAPWPGIYHFSDGRLKEIDRAPAPPEPVKPVKKQKAKKPVKPKTATNHTDPGYDRTYVQ